MSNKNFPTRYPKDSLKHQIGDNFRKRMKYFLEVFEKQKDRVPTFDDIFNKSVELAMEVVMFKDMYKKMFDIYIDVRTRNAGITALFERIRESVFADVAIRFVIEPNLVIGYVKGLKNKDYEIRTPYSWFTLLHEFVHVYLRELDFPNDERLAFIIPAGIYYFYKYYNNRRSMTLDDFF